MENKVNFRKNHILQILRQFEGQTTPFDHFINAYFRRHRALGSKDRAYIAHIVFGMIRYKEILDYLVGRDSNYERKFHYFIDPHFEDLKKNSQLPAHVRAGVPKAFYQKLCQQFGQEKGEELASICNKEAPITVRINPNKIDRETLLSSWGPLYGATPCMHSPYGIQFPKRRNFGEMEEFQAGLFEVQDEGSQLVSLLIKAKPKDKVMDYCAGSGGKTLGFAHRLQNRGMIYLHDVRTYAIQQAKKRLARARITNVTFLPDLRSLKGKMDWVLVDAPCSGTGTYRRNVDLKWKFSLDMLKKVVIDQQRIFSEALLLLHPKGKIVYATCSLLHEENEAQIDYFLKKYPLTLEQEPFCSLPSDQGMDGFFAATFRFTPV